MKRIFLIYSTLLIHHAVFSQWTTNGSNIYFSGGSVSIGTAAVNGVLQVYGGATFLESLNLGYGASTAVMTTDASGKPICFQIGGTEYARLAGNGYFGLGTSSPSTQLEIAGGSNGGFGPVMRLTGGGGINAQVAIDLATYSPGANAPAGRIMATDDGAYGSSISFLSKVPGQNTDSLQTRLFISDTGNIGINTINTQGYRLAVNGSAIFTSARVKAYGNWPDYVFAKEYRLPSLDSLSRFIQYNGHLPDIPSADSMQSAGIDLGGTDAALLKKVEELTLYLIDQNKTLATHNKTIARLQARLHAEQKEIITLKAMILANKKNN